MPPIIVHVSTKTLLVAALIVMLGALTVFGGVLISMSDSQPEILEGDFVDDGSSGLLAVSETQSCSTDGDCPSTTCDGDNYLVDTDGEVSCVDHDGDGTTECAGYDKTYADAEYCGGRYDYNCDSTGCDGYKAACEDDCSANSGCDTYDFCGSDDDDDSSSSSSGGSSGSDTSSCTDTCESLTKKCSDGNVVQCQDTDSDSCTDGFVKIASCDDTCENAACVTPTDTDEDTAEETEPETGTDTDTDTTDSQTLDERIAEVWTGVWTTLFGWM